MKQITRNLITYSAEIHASVEELENRLPNFATLGDHQRASSGFVNVIPDQDVRVLKVPGGWAICLREDSKAVPASEVNKAAAEKAEQVQKATGHKPGKKEMKEIKDEVIHELLPRAFARQKLTYILYSERTQRLFVNTNSQKSADFCDDRPGARPRIGEDIHSARQRTEVGPDRTPEELAEPRRRRRLLRSHGALRRSGAQR